MPPDLVGMRKYHPPMEFEAGGDLVLYTDAAAAGTFDKSASFGGTRTAKLNLRIEQFRLIQMDDGTSGTTTVEIYRRRGGSNTLVGSVSLAQGGGDHSSWLAVPASEALRELQRTDQVLCHFAARQPGGRDVMLEVDFS